MKTYYKFLLFIELICLFIAPVTLLIIGSFLGNLVWTYFILNGGAILGMVGIISLLVKLLFPNVKILPPKIILFLIVCGILVVCSLEFLNKSSSHWQIILLAQIFPLIGTLHLVFLCRHYLFSIKNK